VLSAYIGLRSSHAPPEHSPIVCYELVSSLNHPRDGKTRLRSPVPCPTIDAKQAKSGWLTINRFGALISWHSVAEFYRVPPQELFANHDSTLRFTMIMRAWPPTGLLRRLIRVWIPVSVLLLLFYLLPLRSTLPSHILSNEPNLPEAPPLALANHTYRSDGLLEVNPDGPHPIYELIDNAERRWKEKLEKASKTLEEAVTEYKRRYRRRPPRGFDLWYAP